MTRQRAPKGPRRQRATSLQGWRRKPVQFDSKCGNCKKALLAHQNPTHYLYHSLEQRRVVCCDCAQAMKDALREEPE